MPNQANIQAFNPYLPCFEYVPDGEPHIFLGRLYIFGSHDRFNGPKFCLNDYVCWSAPLEDLGNWRFEGEIYQKTQDPDNADGKLELWAPDVAQGLDGRYYLYYCLARYNKIGVAVCDHPAGKYEFLAFVHYQDGTALGQRQDDVFQFDPAVLVDDDGKVFLYSGQGPRPKISQKLAKDETCRGSLCLELNPDMVTVRTEPKDLIAMDISSKSAGFEGHEFFEASSIRKFHGKYYFIYSSVLSHELCYAVSAHPDSGFRFGGTLVSIGDVGLQGKMRMEFGSKPNRNLLNYVGNTHGSLIELKGKYYVFYHRQTHRNLYSRQGCAEAITMLPDGRFQQAELTSCGLNNGPLRGEGVYEARIACHLMSRKGATYCVDPLVQDHRHPAFTQEGQDREDHPDQFIENMRDGSKAGFKYFAFHGAKTIAVTVRGKCDGFFVVFDGLDGNMVSKIELKENSNWTLYVAPLKISDGIRPLYFVFEGQGFADFKEFEIRK